MLQYIVLGGYIPIMIVPIGDEELIRRQRRSNSATHIKNIISEKISKNGPITFFDYMKETLSDPQYGYYGSGRAQISDGRKVGSTGTENDFITKPTEFSPVYGAAMGSMISRIGLIRKIVSLGAGRGIFDNDILNSLSEFAPELYKSLEYTLVDINPQFTAEQKIRLAEHKCKIRFVNASALDFDLGEELTNTLVLSNELPDAFPVHKVRKNNGKFEEAYVIIEQKTVNGTITNEFCEIWLELSESAGKCLDIYGAAGRLYEEGDKIILNPGLITMAKNIERQLSSGIVITTDYGNYFHKTLGTIRTYHMGHPIDYFQYPGETDITSDIDFKILEASSHKLNTIHIGSDMNTLAKSCDKVGLESKYGVGFQKFVSEADRSAIISNMVMMIQKTSDFIISSDLVLDLAIANVHYSTFNKFVVRDDDFI